MINDGKTCGIELEDGNVRKGDYVISTMPLTQLVKGIDSLPDELRNINKKLYFRNTILVYLQVESDNLFPDNLDICTLSKCQARQDHKL